MTNAKLVIATLMISAVALAQAPRQAGPPPGGAPGMGPGMPGGDMHRMPGGDMQRMPGPGGMDHGPQHVDEMRLRHGPDGGPGGPHMPPGKWWKGDAAQRIGLTEQQAGQIEKIFQDHRMQLIDLHANLEKQEATLEPLIESDQPNEQAVLAQIDKVATARAALEKSNASMMLGIRRVLNAEQWKKLHEPHPMMPAPAMAPRERQHGDLDQDKEQ